MVGDLEVSWLTHLLHSDSRSNRNLEMFVLGRNGGREGGKHPKNNSNNNNNNLMLIRHKLTSGYDQMHLTSN